MTTIAPGDFSWSPDQEILGMGYRAVAQAEGWSFLKTYVPDQGFMFGKTPPKLEEINKKINELYPGHSGSSYGWTMRHMQSIAVLDWELYLKKLEKIPASEADKLTIKRLEAPNQIVELGFHITESQRLLDLWALDPRTTSHHFKNAVDRETNNIVTKRKQIAELEEILGVVVRRASSPPLPTYTHHWALTEAENRLADYVEHNNGIPTNGFEARSAGWAEWCAALKKRKTLLEK